LQSAENDRIHRDVGFICAKPLYDTWIGRSFGGLTQNVGVDQILDSASVDSESVGTKKSLRGPASSQSITA
jgi:hypothetical protein